MYGMFPDGSVVMLRQKRLILTYRFVSSKLINGLFAVLLIAIITTQILVDTFLPKLYFRKIARGFLYHSSD